MTIYDGCITIGDLSIVLRATRIDEGILNSICKMDDCTGGSEMNLYLVLIPLPQVEEQLDHSDQNVIELLFELLVFGVVIGVCSKFLFLRMGNSTAGSFVDTVGSWLMLSLGL